MSEIVEKALDLIDTFEVRRARDVEESILKSMTAPIVNGIEQRNIIECFSERYLQDDQDGSLASFVVMSPTNIPLVFFSLRCGELFSETQVDKMKIGYDAIIALKDLMNGLCDSDEKRKRAIAALQAAKDEGLSPDDCLPLYWKKQSWKQDRKLESKKDVIRVLESYPAVELKLFGINESAKKYWKSLGLPKDFKMGETLFWLKGVETLKRMMKYVGCKYVYLFAADNEPEGQLVQYYRVRLGFRSDSNLAANKPQFDWESQFLFQSIDELMEGRDQFMSKMSK